MSEFGLIDRIKAMNFAQANSSNEGIGDDCAVQYISDTEAMLYTSDLLVEGVHFLSHATSAYDLGHKAIAVNLSDVAAMGARPSAVLLSLALPERFGEKWVMEFMEGMQSLAQRYQVMLIGGDTTRSKSDLVINITAMGRVQCANIKRRSAAEEGDVIYVTGELGRSAAGLQDILKGDYTSENAKIHFRPMPRIEEGEWFGHRHEVNAMMDISDGIGSDLRHIIKASDCGADINLENIPTSQCLDYALSGGEDYELLLSCKAAKSKDLEAAYEAHFGKKLHPIGTITSARNKLRWLKDACEQEDIFKGFQHF